MEPAFTTARHLSLSWTSSIQSIPHIPLHEAPSQYILPSNPGSPKWSLPLRFPHQNSVHIFAVPNTVIQLCSLFNCFASPTTFCSLWQSNNKTTICTSVKSVGKPRHHPPPPVSYKSIGSWHWVRNISLWTTKCIMCYIQRCIGQCSTEERRLASKWEAERLSWLPSCNVTFGYGQSQFWDEGNCFDGMLPVLCFYPGFDSCVLSAASGDVVKLRRLLYFYGDRSEACQYAEGFLWYCAICLGDFNVY